MTPQQRPKATIISKYNAGVSTLCLGLLVKLVVVVNALSIDNRGLQEQINATNRVLANLGGTVRYIQMDLSSACGIINADGNRVTKLEAILTNKKQFNIQSE